MDSANECLGTLSTSSGQYKMKFPRMGEDPSRRPRPPAWLRETLGSTACRCSADTRQRSANAEAVITLAAGGVRRELLAFWTDIVEHALKRLMVVEQLQLAQHAHRSAPRSAASIVA